MEKVRSAGFNASRAALVAMTRMEVEFFSRAISANYQTASAVQAILSG